MADGQDMMDAGLMKQCLALPFGDRVELIGVLSASVAVARAETPAQRYAYLKEQMERVIGMPIPNRGKESVYSWARKMLGFQMSLDGYGDTAIGRLMGRDHSSVYFYRRSMKDALSLPDQYADIVETWNTFQKLIQK